MNPITSSKLLPLSMMLMISIITSSLLKAEELIKAELITLSLKGKVGPYYYISEKEVNTLSVSETGTRGPIEYSGPSSLALYLEEPSEEAINDKKIPLPKPDLQVKLDHREGRVLLLFSEKKSSTPETPQAVVKAFPLSNKSSNRGGYKILNFSGKDAFISLDTQKKKVKAKGQATMSSSAWKKKKSDLQISLGIKRDDKVETVYNSVWGHYPNQRVILLIFDKPGNKPSLRVQRIYDLPKG